MYNFKNCILIVVFNFSDCICNKDVLKKIYEKHFKQIIFYSDYPVIDDPEINFIDIKKGFNLPIIFNHFYTKYKELINDVDGIFYTMDDNIINTNILNLYRNDKIIYYYNEIKTLDHYSGWHWSEVKDGKFGKQAINQLLQDVEFQKYNINKFSGTYSDWFYLPKQYLTKELFHLFDLFSRYEVFLEITIPSIINNIEPDKTKYQTFTHEMLWGGERYNFLNNEYIYHSLNSHHNLIIHPVKFNQNPDSKTWLTNFFCKEKCVIITTINKPTETVLKHINNPEYDVIIVGDNKTPDNYKGLHCIYLDVSAQKKLFPEFADLIPYNHYARKNIGYLYAIKKGYKVIYETDDDNIPYDNFDTVLQYDKLQMITEKNSPWINIFKYFTNNAYIWPRGYPLSLLKTNPNYSIQDTDKNPSIICGLVENDPDVDALFRIICNHQEGIRWEKDKSILINNQNICVFNTQNTFWLNPELFIGLLIPSSVSFRYCDILRGIICNILLKHTNNYMMYTSPNVVQYRNEHNLIEDFKSEYEMYLHNEKILDFIVKKPTTYLYIIQTASHLPEKYECLRKRDYILLSYKENTPDTTIFYPNSTWTTGRNKLREYVLEINKKYDYYIFLDEDIVFCDYSQEDGFNAFEHLLYEYKPYIANPNFGSYYEHYGNRELLGEFQTTVWYDGMYNAFSHDAFTSNEIFPYIDIFDNRCWWMSQYIMIILCSIYKNEVVFSTNIKIYNEIHSEYPKENIFIETREYIVNELLKKNPEIDVNWDHKNFKPIFKKDTNISDLLLSTYTKLLENNVITSVDIDILNKWNSYFTTV